MIDVDTTKLKKGGEDIVKLSNDFKELCNGLYSRLYNIPYKTGEWYGTSAIKFSESTIDEKIESLEFKNELYEFGKTMIEVANSYNTEITNNK